MSAPDAEDAEDADNEVVVEQLVNVSDAVQRIERKVAKNVKVEEPTPVDEPEVEEEKKEETACIRNAWKYL